VFDFQSKFKRQIEILGLCLSDHAAKPLKTLDLAEYFNVEDLTIKRDLQVLRSYGIDIHSHKKVGVHLSSKLSKEKIVDIILHYAGLNHNEYALDKSATLLVEKLGIAALSNLVKLQMCIDKSEAALVDYNKIGKKVDKERLVEPLLIFQSEGSWRIIVVSGGNIRQLLFDKILSVKLTGKRFEKADYKVSELMKYSWKSWFGNEKFHVKMWMSAFWAEIISPKMLAADQKITQNDDGSIIFECTVNSINEIAGWVVSRGEGVKVLEPNELKNKVIELADGALSNYIV